MSSGPTTQPPSLSGFDVENRSAPRPTWHRVFRPGWFSKHALGTVCLLTVLLALTSGVAISKRPGLAIQAFSESKADSTSRAPILEVASPAQHPPRVIIPQATPNALSTPSLRDQVAIVEPGQTLRKICLRHLGGYSLRIVQHIQALNPGLDPNHIEVGQRIRLSSPGAGLNHRGTGQLKAWIASSEGKGI